MLLVMNIYAVFIITNISLSNEISDQLPLNRDKMSSMASYHTPQPKIDSEVISGKTTLSTDKESYAPGEWATITAESTTDEMNGSLEWQLESPIGEVAFDFYSIFQDIFEDRFFNDPAIPDWTNEGFYSIEATSGYLNLTEVADTDKNDTEVFYNTTELNPDRYVISFDYFSQGQNLLLNPSFEGGITPDWFFNSSYVQSVDDPKNASEGSYYLDVNGTEGYLLEQNVSIIGGNIKRKFIVSVKATGTTNDNHWRLELQAYNSTGYQLGSDKISDYSLDASSDEKGYVTTAMIWEIPENTTKLRFRFRGRDSGVDDLYTGWVDDCYLYEVPPILKFSYYGADNTWKERSLDAETYEWQNASYEVEMGKNLSKTFRFKLPDDNTFKNNATSFWLIDNFAVNLVADPKHDPITNSEAKFGGKINSTWFHRGVREELTSSYNVEVEDPENATSPSECKATIKVLLPIHQVYFGSWIFVFKIHQVDVEAEYLDTKAINISFIIEEPMNYVVQDIYLLRGYTNKTIGNDSVFTEYFEQETNIQAISPGDNVTLLGFLEANSTKGEWYSLNYLQIGSSNVEYNWYSNWQSRENITWGSFGFIPFDKNGKTILDGNFSSPYDNHSTMALNFKIPNRGIYGNLSANLTITLIGDNIKPDGVGGEPLSLTIQLNLPPVKFKIDIVEENLPATSYYLTDYLGGNITLKFLNYNDTLETVFSNRTISSNISIPVKDLELTIFLDNWDKTPDKKEISQRFHYHFIGKTVIWLDPVNPSLLAGTYAFRIRWNTPYKFGVQDQEELDISHLIEIKGSLVVILSKEFPEIQQGGQKTINFSVRLDNETGKRIGGLDLLGIVLNNQTNGNLVIYEEEGVYKIDLDVALEVQPNNYTIEIFVVGRVDAIGELTYRVTERPEAPREEETPLDVVISVGGFLIFILVSIGVIGAMYWANKSWK